MNAVISKPAPSTPALPVMLVVDDEDGPRKSIRIVFQDQFRVLLATNGDEALAIARSQPVDVAICDIRMAGCSGIDVLRGFKQINPSTEVIMLTAYETLDTARQALRLGACDYLSKPFDLSTIRESAARALHLHRISDHLASTAGRLKDLTNRLDDIALREEVARTTNEIYAGVLHDINNPLTVIAGYVQLLSARLQDLSILRGEDLDKVRADLTHIGKQVDTCTAIASRYLRFIHHREFPDSHLPVSQVLKDLQSLLNAHPVAEGHQLVIRSLPDDATPLVDATDLLQILLNLTINAFQSSSKEQTVRVTATRLEDPLPTPLEPPEETEIVLGEPTFTNQPPLLALTISDQGTGISSQNLKRIFEPYFTTKVQTGTGLGLAIVARLVQTNNGLVHFKTVPEQGTEVTVYFPLKA
ncbi:MAG TPA: response regulator [Rariglobus sp.]|jgi:signal transduction histidine kinase|nr:response regulator [Rariglobus sp.]